MKRILIIENGTAITGGFKCAFNEACLLRDDYEFVFVVPAGSIVVPVLEAAGFKVYQLPFVEIGKALRKLVLYVPMLFGNAVKLKKIIRKENIDVIQANDFYNILGAVVKMLGFKGKLITYVRLLPASLPGPLSRFWLKMAQRYGNKIIAVSKAVQAQIAANKKNTVLYDAVFFPETSGSSPLATQPATRFLYLANYIVGKGQNYAVTAFTSIAAKYPDAVLIFVGGDMGLEKNKQFRQGLEQEAAAAGLSARVTFAGFSPDVERTIKEADVLLNFSENESFSMTCAEASFYGVPVIATRCGGPEEIIDNKKTGLLVAKGDITEMAEAMAWMAAHKEERQ